MKVIEAEDLSKNFRVKRKEKGMRGSIRSIFHPQTEEICAVDSVSFGVEEGEILAFIGPNGAGKSTTIKMLTGILYPDSGHVEVLGIDPVRKRRQLAYQIGTVFGQKEQLWIHLTPYDNFRFLNWVRLSIHQFGTCRWGSVSAVRSWRHSFTGPKFYS